jgi:hypothetical protein
MIRRYVMITLTALALAVPLAGLATAAPVPPTPAPVQAPVGPECRPSVTSGVLAALAATGTPLPTGRKIQYLQVSQRTDGVYFLEPCVIIIPA